MDKIVNQTAARIAGVSGTAILKMELATPTASPVIREINAWMVRGPRLETTLTESLVSREVNACMVS